MEKQQWTNWQAVGIGICVGLVITILGFFWSAVSGPEGSIIPVTVIYIVIGIPSCIVGALVGKYLTNTKIKILASSIAGAFPISIIVYLLMYVW